MILRLRYTLSALLLVLCSACGGSDEPSGGEQAGGPYLRCAPAKDDGSKESFKLPPLTLTRDGYDLEVRGLDGGVVILGLLAGIHEMDPQTTANLGFFMDQFKAAGVQAVLVAGGIGLEAAELGGVLDGLAEAPVPILISPGAQESLHVMREEIAKRRKRSPQLIDMTKVRRVRMGRVEILSLPGYRNAFYLEAKEGGCSYEPGDLSDVASLCDKARTTVLLSATPSRGRGPEAVDRGRGGVNIGDPHLGAMMKGAGISFGLFGHVYEAGGAATSMDGETPAAQGVWQDSLLLQAGSAEAVPVSLGGGGVSVGMAHVVEISGSRGRYRSIQATGSSRR